MLLLDKQNPKLLIRYFSDSDDRRCDCIAVVDREQAFHLLDILENVGDTRLDVGSRLAKCLVDLAQREMLDSNCNITVGLPGRVRRPLYFRSCILLSKLLLSRNELQRSLIKKSLREFIGGNTAVSVV